MQAHRVAVPGSRAESWTVLGVAGGRRNGGFKPFLHHVSKGSRPQARRTIAFKAPKKLPRVVTAAEMQAILDACEHLRDRFLFVLLCHQPLGLGHCQDGNPAIQQQIRRRISQLASASPGLDPDSQTVRSELGQAARYPNMTVLTRLQLTSAGNTTGPAPE